MGLVTDKTREKNKPRVNHEPRSAHGRAVNKNLTRFVQSLFSVQSVCTVRKGYACGVYSSNNGSQSERADKVIFKTQMEKKLSQTEQDPCEGLLTKTECLEALKNMECNKTPGSDGLPREFYKVFWNDMVDFFLKSLNYAHKQDSCQ